MNLRHDNLGRSIDGVDAKREERNSEEKKRDFGIFKAALEYCRSHARVIAIAASATVFAYCGSPGKFNVGDVDENDTHEEVDADNDAVPDVEPDEITDTIGEDIIDDTEEEDIVEEDVAEEDVVEEDSPPVPTCFTIPTPIDSATNPLFNNTGSQSATLNNTGPEAIDADLQTNVSMTGYSLAVPLGVCPDDPDSIAMVANPDTAVDFEADVSMIAGNPSWSAEVPDVAGIKCPALSLDDENLITKNSTHQQVPKNADMSGTMSVRVNPMPTGQ